MGGIINPSSFSPNVNTLFSSGVLLSHTGNTAYTPLVDVSIPAGTLSIGDLIRITFHAGMTGAFTNGAYVFGDANGNGFAYGIFTGANTNYFMQSIISVNTATQLYIQNPAQGASPWGLTGDTPNVDNTININNDPLPIQIAVDLANAADTVRIYHYCIEHIKATS